MSDINRQFGKRIHAIRQAKKLTQEEFAYLCGLQPSHIGQLERGTKSPTLGTLDKIATGTGLTLAELLMFEGAYAETCDDAVVQKILARLEKLSTKEKTQILEIIKTFLH